tara:strand:- start:850 stop:1566 length:717 start_codon:yes stop_codon:yes gene_type:complete
MSTLSNILKSSVPRYTIKQPSTNKKVEFRPFLVKEEKVLLQAQETDNNETSMLLAIKGVIESCFDDISDAGNLPIFDIEYMFINLRAKSVGEVVNPTIVCPYTNEEVSVTINLGDIQVNTYKNHTNTIHVAENIILEMMYPSIKILSERDVDYDDPLSFYDLIVDCIRTIETPEETINVQELSRSEIQQFVDNMTKEQFDKILDFFLTAPKLEHIVQYETSDGEAREVVLRGLSDFFA